MIDSVYGANGGTFWRQLIEVGDNGYFERHGYGGAEELGIFGELETICESLGFV